MKCIDKDLPVKVLSTVWVLYFEKQNYTSKRKEHEEAGGKVYQALSRTFSLEIIVQYIQYTVYLYQLTYHSSKIQ